VHGIPARGEAEHPCRSAPRGSGGAAAFPGRAPFTGWASDLLPRAPPPAAPAPTPAAQLCPRIPGRAANSCLAVHGSTSLPSARFGSEARARRPSPPCAVARSQLLPGGEGNSSRPPPLQSGCTRAGGEDAGRGGQMSAVPLGFPAGLAARQPCLLPPQLGRGFCYSCFPLSAMFFPLFLPLLHLSPSRERNKCGVRRINK